MLSDRLLPPKHQIYVTCDGTAAGDPRTRRLSLCQVRIGNIKPAAISDMAPIPLRRYGIIQLQAIARGCRRWWPGRSCRRRRPSSIWSPWYVFSELYPNVVALTPR